MTERKNTKIKKLIFPVGIFLLMFASETIIGAAGIVSYFYFSGKKNISDIQNYTFNYSKTMAEAFAGVAEFSYSTKKYSSLKTLFHEKIEENTIDEAFFVMDDGKLIVHSSTTAEKELMGNIASDEMAYNLDMILLPLRTKSSDLIFNNYNIVNRAVPFKRYERDLLKKYVYEDVDSTGWLFTKCIFYKSKPVGTVNFIISKDRIYASIRNSIKQAEYYILLLIASSMILSFFVAVIVLLRYRSIQKNALRSGLNDTEVPVAVTADQPSAGPGKTVQDDIILYPPDNNFIEPEMDYIVDDDFDTGIIEEDGSVSNEKITRNDARPGTTAPLRRHEVLSDEDEYITVELLGEIEPEPEPVILHAPVEEIREYIAPVINLDDYKKSVQKEIRDAIPIRKKR